MAVLGEKPMAIDRPCVLRPARRPMSVSVPTLNERGASSALLRVVDAAYEKRSVALSSNIHPSGFDELMPKTLATATVERLLHHAHVLITDGQDSYRLAQATAGKGVQPLA